MQSETQHSSWSFTPEVSEQSSLDTESPGLWRHLNTNKCWDLLALTQD